MSRRIIEHAIEAGDFDETIQSHCEIVEAYNREDCESAERLRDWLEELRARAITEGVWPKYSADVKNCHPSEHEMLNRVEFKSTRISIRGRVVKVFSRGSNRKK